MNDPENKLDPIFRQDREFKDMIENLGASVLDIAVSDHEKYEVNKQIRFK